MPKHASLHIVKIQDQLATRGHNTAASEGIESNSENPYRTYRDRGDYTCACTSKDAASNGSTSSIRQGDDIATQERERRRISYNQLRGAWKSSTWIGTIHSAIIYTTDNKTGAIGYIDW